MKLYANGADVTNQSLTAYADSGETRNETLVLKAVIGNDGASNSRAERKTQEVQEVVLNNSALVQWDVSTMSGTVSVKDDGTLVVGAGARGMVSGKLMVSHLGGLTAAATFGAQSEGSKKDTNLFTVTFDSQSGSNVSAINGNRAGSTITKPADPTLSGYSFGGWYKEAECINAWNFDTSTVIWNITLYAKWIKSGEAGGGSGGGGGAVFEPEVGPNIVVNRKGWGMIFFSILLFVVQYIHFYRQFHKNRILFKYGLYTESETE